MVVISINGTTNVQNEKNNNHFSLSHNDTTTTITIKIILIQTNVHIIF